MIIKHKIMRNIPRSFIVSGNYLLYNYYERYNKRF